MASSRRARALPTLAPVGLPSVTPAEKSEKLPSFTAVQEAPCGPSAGADSRGTLLLLPGGANPFVVSGRLALLLCSLGQPLHAASRDCDLRTSRPEGKSCKAQHAHGSGLQVERIRDGSLRVLHMAVRQLGAQAAAGDRCMVASACL